MKLGAIILAAGEGKRMKGDKAKVLYELDGKPMIDFVLEAIRAIEPTKIVVVVGNRMEQVVAHLKSEKVVFCVQLEQRGTADAVLSASAPFAGFDGQIVVTCGDMPLVRAVTFKKLLEYHREKKAAATVLSGILDEPMAYGRIVRDETGNLEKIVEFADASEEVRAIKEINSGTYIFESVSLWSALREIGADNAQNEFYLTDVVEILRKKGELVAVMPSDDPAEVMGVNTPTELGKAEKASKRLTKGKKCSS